MDVTAPPPGHRSEALTRAWATVSAAAPPGTTALTLPDACLDALGLPTPANPHRAETLDDDFRRDLLTRQLAALARLEALDDAAVARLREHADRLVRDTDVMRTTDDNLVLVPRAELDPAALRWLAHRNALTERLTPLLLPTRATVQAPFVLIGLAPASAVVQLLRFIRALDPDIPFTRRLVLVHDDEPSLAAALSAFDITELIEDDAVSWFIGNGAVERFDAWLQEDITYAPSGQAAMWGDGPDGTATPQLRNTAERTTQALKAAFTRRDQALAEWRRANDNHHAAATTSDFRRRFHEAARAQRRLRILISTSAHSTYTRHAAAGLRDAFNALGHDAALLLERDASSVMTSAGYARAVAGHRPDLMIVVNYPRTALGDCIPANLPYVCWIQDPMPHLMDTRIGKAQTGFDMTAGVVMPSLWERFWYRPEMALPCPLPAVESTFHDGPVADEIQRRFTCDVAFVSHHSETPEHMRDRLRDALGESLARTIDRLWEEAQDLVEAAAHDSVRARAVAAVDRAQRDVIGRPPDAREASLLLHQVLEPLAGQIFRHRTLRDVADVADRRGWTFHIYGRGWHDAGPFARFARGPVEYGEHLRDCYRCARVHLHIDLTTLMHQRVFECALSGGFPIARFHLDAIRPAEVVALDELIERNTPLSTRDDGVEVHAVEGCTAAERLMAARAHVGLETHSEMTVTPADRACIIGHAEHRLTRLAPFDPLQVLDGLEGAAFHDRQSLTALLERAVSDEPWRHARRQRMRAGVARHASASVFAQRLIEHAARVLGWRERRAEAGLRPAPGMQDLREAYEQEWAT